MSDLASLAAVSRGRRRPRSLVLADFLTALASCTSAENGLIEPGVTVQDVALPVEGAVYRGAEAHVFAGGQVTLFCGTHGVFSSSVAPPQQLGQTVLSEYVATFEGELILRPPVVASTVIHTLSVQARMAESITLVSTSGSALTLDTELVTFALEGTEMPDGIMVRESPTLASTGVTTVTPLADGRSRVQTRYDVWLEISLDEGRSWDAAVQAVRMTLEPS